MAKHAGAGGKDKAGRAGRARGAKGASRAPGAGPTRTEHWKDEPDEHDYPAAADYLSLLLRSADVAGVLAALQAAPIERRKAKDLLRASRLPLLDETDPSVERDLAKVRHGTRLSPVLCVRGSLASDVALTVADGYHRICASYHLNEDADIPCHLVDPPAGAGAPRARAAAKRPTGADARPTDR